MVGWTGKGFWEGVALVLNHNPLSPSGRGRWYVLRIEIEILGLGGAGGSLFDAVSRV